ncbi:hypothetical protein MJG53_016598 [Ovis ammon polii x Ovis aries]|uniref:Single-pass membrane and coiled-coil domain-containing protein 4 n=3 Tax=Caprinae TaxID=9963 RepID=A0A836CST0_SHEEP|nr:hypothetical protein JEQ12_010864 [Ovis aries]KAI4561544.1 hypothetical protein MJG53_016598 [Ovis ammon polii x Ovis aries]
MLRIETIQSDYHCVLCSFDWPWPDQACPCTFLLFRHFSSWIGTRFRCKPPSPLEDSPESPVSQTHLPGASQGTMMAVERILVETPGVDAQWLHVEQPYSKNTPRISPCRGCSCLRPWPGKMRQLKGKPKKETSRDKKERKQAMQEARRQITTVVLPTLAVVVLLIVVFVYVATRPASAE